MMMGALGIVLGLVLFGPKSIKTVGSGITEPDQTRAFSIAMTASIRIIIASQLSLPVSSTHIAVSGVFGVGFLREYLKSSHARMINEIKSHHQGANHKEVEEFLAKIESASIDDKAKTLKQLNKKQPLLN